ncbi:hypothetical protein L6164_029153 [Bauhinia variegata]|uniref:Uncharacterized protein n=1 Tax=Bauhinia variegata TaxID=167791 RepID=A0ACB9L8E2_BAUVA|nr:hypothetical protein L6164_029153 [Bauhinia variegata]
MWPGIHTLSVKNVHPSGFSVALKADVVLLVDLPWSGKIWGRTNCSWNRNTLHCKAGDCGTGQDRCYGKVSQPPASKVDLNMASTDWLTKFDENGERIGCKSACMVTGLPQHCCTGACADPEKCVLNPYSQFINYECPNALSYRFQNKNFSCFGGVGFGTYFCG